MVADAQSTAGVAFTPHLGGGTRLMFALEHRISDDIDLFVRDMQWIGYLTPRLNDRFEDRIRAGARAGYDVPRGTHRRGVWTAIQAPDKPPIEDAVSWAKGKVAGYRSCQR